MSVENEKFIKFMVKDDLQSDRIPDWFWFGFQSKAFGVEKGLETKSGLTFCLSWEKVCSGKGQQIFLYRLFHFETIEMMKNSMMIWKNFWVGYQHFEST